jgi:hypothetical protein
MATSRSKETSPISNVKNDFFDYFSKEQDQFRKAKISEFLHIQFYNRCSFKPLNNSISVLI